MENPVALGVWGLRTEQGKGFPLAEGKRGASSPRAAPCVILLNGQQWCHYYFCS